MANNPKLHEVHRWLAAFGAGLVGALTWGAALSFSQFIPAISEEFNTGRGLTSWIGAISLTLGAFANAIGGRAADVFSIRNVVIVGGFVGAVGWLISSFMPQYYLLYLTFPLVGFSCGMSYMPSLASVGYFFGKEKSKYAVAISIASCGASVGNLIVPQLARILIEKYGWRGTFRIFTSFGIMISLLGFLVNPPPHKLPSKHLQKPKISSLLQIKNFRLLFFAITFAYLGFFAPFAHIVPYTKDLGFSVIESSIMLSVMGASGIIGRIGFGFFAEKFGRLMIFRLALFTMSLSTACWTLASNVVSVTIFVIAYGSAAGAFIGLVPSLSIEKFGVKYSGTAAGVLYSGGAVGYLSGAPLAGFLYDRFGSYLAGSLVISALVLIGFILLWFVDHSSLQDEVQLSSLQLVPEKQRADSENVVSSEETVPLESIGDP